MKASEIQIGDWLYYKGRFNAFPFKVEQVTKHKIGYHAEPGDNRIYHIRLNEVQPIPLTPEILEKNEIDTVFKTRYKGFYLEYHAEAEMIMLYVYNNGSFQPTGIGFKYVHQLQHALRLCGIEKEIML